MTQPPVELKVLTFNLWGIFNSKMREDRMAHFASKVEHYDIILLQEQFDPTDFAMIESLVPERVRKTRYFRRFPSGFYGSGCAVISKYPITSAFFHIYPLQGYPEMILHGDFFANKGAALVKVDVPVERDGAIVKQEVILYTTHLVAVYQKVSLMTTWKKERYLPYRISQALSLADFIVNTSRPTDSIIIGGDFNSSQRSLEVQMLLILLKRKGYDLRSVLPTPSTMLELAKTEQDAENARSFFTYSYRNAFNSSKTSYFKLLKLEADIPSQIDHIFFNAGAFTLRSFEDCPDASPSYPFEIDATGDGTKVPTGVVVFTKNEVARSLTPSLRERVAAALRASSANKPRSLTGRLANLLVAPRKTTSALAEIFPTDESQTRYPISDHFGVACRLVMHPMAPATAATTPSDDENWQHVSAAAATAGDSTAGASAAGAAGSVALTEEELLIVNNVERFLTGFVAKLRHQVKVTRVMAGVSVAILIVNTWMLRRVAAAQEQRMATAMQHLYQVATKEGARVKASAGAEVGNASLESKLMGGTAALLSKASQWSSKALGAVGIRINKGAMTNDNSNRNSCGEQAKDAMETPAAVGTVPNFKVLSHELCLRPFWASVSASALITVVGSIVSVGAFAIGMFQRQGNANIMEEQVRLISPLRRRQATRPTR